MTDAARLAQAQLDAYNAHDIDAFVDCYHPDVQIFDLHSGTQRMAGHAAMRERYGPMFERLHDLRADVVNRIATQTTCVDHEQVVGLRDGVVEAVAIYQVRDGLIVKVWFS